MSQDLMKQFKEMKKEEVRINPDRSWVLSNKECLMSQIGNTVNTDEKTSFNMNTLWQGVQVYLPGRLAYSIVRPVAVFLLILTITASGWITTVGATQNQLPGDFAYSVKVAVSKVTKNNIDIAKDIAQDIKKVAIKKEKDTVENVAVGVDILKKTLDSANEDIKKASEEKPEEAVEKAKKMSEDIKEINDNLKETKKEIEKVVAVAKVEGEVVEEGASEAVKDVTEQVEAVKDLATKTAQEAVEDVVQKQVDGELEVDGDEIKDLVKDYIETISDNVDSVTEKVEDVAGVMASSTLTISISESTTVINVSDSTSTEDIIPTTSTIDIQEIVKSTVDKINETGETAKQNLEEARDLVEGDHLLEAIEKAKEVNDSTEESESAVEGIKKVVEDAVVTLPSLPSADGGELIEIGSGTTTLEEVVVEENVVEIDEQEEEIVE